MYTGTDTQLGLQLGTELSGDPAAVSPFLFEPDFSERYPRQQFVYVMRNEAVTEMAVSEIVVINTETSEWQLTSFIKI